MKYIQQAANLNCLWARLMVEELVRQGIDYFCIAPGSRSSPLALAVAEHSRTQSFIHFDERGLGFYALGLASAAKKPCVVITTSGTAAANLLPSVVEASKKKLPIIYLTADRPPELRFTGANQTIDQVGIFGKFVRWFFDMPCPAAEIPASFVLTTIDQAVAKAKGELNGPVHLNCMFREPLAPTKVKFESNYLAPLNRWLKNQKPYTHYVISEKQPALTDLQSTAKEINKLKSGIIAVGKLSSEDDKKAVLKLAEKLNWPIFADITSGLRLGVTHKNVITYCDQILLSKKFKNRSVDGIIQFGGRLTSKRWYACVEQMRPQQYIMVLNHPLRSDPTHQVTLRLHCKPSVFCEQIIKVIKPRSKNHLLGQLQAANTKVHAALIRFFESQKTLSEFEVVRLVTQHIQKNNALFISNSLPIREADMYADFGGPSITIGANRGASGIDGIIATSVGFAQGIAQPTTVLIGDLAALHDLNSLAMLTNIQQPMPIIILNNNGGGIFSFLSIHSHKNFEKYFATPHRLNFKNIAHMFHLNYTQPAAKKEFIEAYKQALKTKHPTILEVICSRNQNVRLQKKLEEIINKIL